MRTFLTYNSGGPFVQRSRTICAILVEGIMLEGQFCENILNLDQWFRRLKKFLSRSLAALMFSRGEPLKQILEERFMDNIHVKL